MTYDAVIIGGSFAGLSAAMQLARAGRAVAVVDAGLPRNRFAARSHGLFALDGERADDLLRKGRERLRAYPSVTFTDGLVVEACRRGAGFWVRLESGDTLTAAGLVIAIGVVDELPDIEGLSDHWGKAVLHCPYCHGYELTGEHVGVLAVSPMAVHQALLVADWGPVTLFLNGGPLAPEDRARLAARGIAIVPGRVERVTGDGDRLDGVELADGGRVRVTALYLATPTRMASPVAEQLGCAFDVGPFGDVIRTDALKLTTVPGVYAAGDAARVPHNASWAMADGVTAGIALHQALVFAAEHPAAVEA